MATELRVDYLVWLDGNGNEQTTPSSTLPVGVRMLFYTNTAPVGWKTYTSLNNCAIRIVSSNGGFLRGNHAFSTVFGKTATNSHTLSTSQMPQHRHTATTSTAGHHGHTLCTSWYNYSKAAQARNWSNSSRASPGISRNYYPIPLAYINQTSSISGAGNHSHSLTTSYQGSTKGHSHTMDIRVKYADFMCCEKEY
jgi:hypothetical protein